MTDNDPLFSSSDDQSPVDPNEGNPDHDYLNDLVGEGKKFRDVQSLAKSVLHKDMHIRDIEQENAQLRQLAQQGLSREEFYEAIKGLKPEPSPSNPAAGQTERNEVSLEQVASLVDERISRTLSEQKQQENLQFAVAECQKRLGSGYQKILQDRAKELGENPQDLTVLARTRPKVFLELMAPQGRKAPDVPGVPHSEVRPATTPVPTGGPKTKAFYDKLRKDDPQRYRTAAVQAQMHKDALALREKFFD